MRLAGLIDADPITSHATGVHTSLESVAMNAVILDGSVYPLNHAFLLVSVGPDEFLAKYITFKQDSVASTVKTNTFYDRRKNGVWIPPR